MKYTTRMIGTVVAFCMAVPVFAQQYKATIPYRMVGEKMIIEMKALGESKKKTIDLKADQNAKTLESAEGGKDKVKYKIDGDVLTLDVSKAESSDYEVFAFFKDAKFKRQK